MTAILGLLSNWRVLAAAAITATAVGVWLYVSHLKAELVAETTRAQQAETYGDLAGQAADINAKAVEATKAGYERDLARLKTVYEDRIARQAQTTSILKVIDDAPDSDDGPVAPVLRRALDSLRDATGNKGGETGSSGEANHPETAAKLRP